MYFILLKQIIQQLQSQDTALLATREKDSFMVENQPISLINFLF